MSVALRPSSIPYSDHREYVLGVLAGRCRWVPPGDREALYHEAYASMLDLERAGRLQPDAMHPRQLRAYLAKAAVRKALDERKSAERRLTSPLDQAAENHPDLSRPVEEQASARFDSGAVREIVAELPPRQRAVVQLRFCLELDPDEVQAVMHISARAYRKDLERAVREIASRYELVREGRWCETRRSLVLAYVAGISGPRRASEARAHLAACPGCARMAGELRQAAAHAAATLPLPGLSLEQGFLERAGGALAHARESMSDIGAGVKHQSASLASRVGDPTPLSGTRPGGVAAAIAGCLAIGGGATYCAVEGVPEVLRGPLGIERTAGPPAPLEQETSPEPAPEPVEAPVSTAPAETDEPVVETPETQTDSPPADAPVAPPTPREQASQEFGFEQETGPATTAPSREFAPPPATPAQSSDSGGQAAGGSQEFGFEN